MNDAALNQLPVNMHDLEEEGNANGFVCLSVCLSDKVVFIGLSSILRMYAPKVPRFTQRIKIFALESVHPQGWKQTEKCVELYMF